MLLISYPHFCPLRPLQPVNWKVTSAHPESLKKLNVEINGNGNLFFRFNSANGHNKIDDVLNFLKNNNYSVKDLSTEESSLEEIFIKLVEENRNELSRNL